MFNYFRLSRTERDNNQKRTLLEDQRTRVKQALESAKSDAESLVSFLNYLCQTWLLNMIFVSSP